MGNLPLYGRWADLVHSQSDVRWLLGLLVGLTFDDRQPIPIFLGSQLWMLLLGMAHHNGFATGASHSNLRSRICQKSMDWSFVGLCDNHTWHLLYCLGMLGLWTTRWPLRWRELVPVLISLLEAIFQDELFRNWSYSSLLVHVDPKIQTHSWWANTQANIPGNQLFAPQQLDPLDHVHGGLWPSFDCAFDQSYSCGCSLQLDHARERSLFRPRKTPICHRNLAHPFRILYWWIQSR